jgi:hypothetical protein
VLDLLKRLQASLAQAMTGEIGLDEVFLDARRGRSIKGWAVGVIQTFE